jgi:predicted porin
MLMKKSLIALAVAGALTAPMVAQADATLYGSMRLLVVDADGSDLDVQDGTSRIGIKGDVDLGIDGVKGIYNFETRLRADEGTFAGNDARLSNIGVTGDFGTALIGRMYTPHWLWTSAVTDATWNDAVIGVVNEIALRQPNTIAYISPSMSGFQAAVAVVANGGTNDDADIVNVAAKYAANGLHLGVSYMTVDDGITAGTESADTIAVAASYTMDAFKVSARYQDEDDVGGTAGSERETTQLGVAYTMGDTTLQARYTNEDIKTQDVDQWAIGVQQMLGSQGRVFLEYADVGSNGFNGAVTSDVDRLSVGYRLDF